MSGWLDVRRVINNMKSVDYAISCLYNYFLLSSVWFSLSYRYTWSAYIQYNVHTFIQPNKSRRILI